MVVDCGDDTVGLTTHKLLGETTFRKYIKYIELLRRELGNSAIDIFSNGQLNYLVQIFAEMQS